MNYDENHFAQKGTKMQEIFALNATIK